MGKPGSPGGHYLGSLLDKGKGMSMQGKPLLPSPWGKHGLSGGGKSGFGLPKGFVKGPLAYSVPQQQKGSYWADEHFAGKGGPEHFAGKGSLGCK